MMKCGIASQVFSKIFENIDAFIVVIPIDLT